MDEGRDGGALAPVRRRPNVPRRQAREQTFDEGRHIPFIAPERYIAGLATREFDLVLLGATGFTGKLVAEYLDRQPAMKWALAGRSRDKLEAVVAGLSTKPPIIVADALDAKACTELAQRAKVICTTVGPYAKYGAMVVAACAASGTHGRRRVATATLPAR